MPTGMTFIRAVLFLASSCHIGVGFLLFIVFWGEFEGPCA